MNIRTLIGALTVSSLQMDKEIGDAFSRIPMRPNLPRYTRGSRSKYNPVECDRRRAKRS